MGAGRCGNIAQTAKNKLKKKYYYLHKFARCFRPNMGHPWAKQHESIYKGRKYLIQGVREVVQRQV